ncbi:protein-S-isoprenylcysteine O-methyltransferase [Malassezia cuniculi]|uniref:Protein-S-isoprenylcysteine O-methyltransferase n=1 Tax=Malassezia cuniculi TaxID=948313 RepID=A0AAF0J9U9_9BASI|nr:protein-S-isoprenylcysteine O-methyltransferase [Malassezia cuniculi]
MHSRNPTLIPAEVAVPVGNAAVVACVLGVLMGGCLTLNGASLAAWLDGAKLSLAVPLQTYFVFVCLFHMLEFYITAHYNPTRLYDDSFLLQNGSEYLLAHGVGIAEHLIELYFWPQMKQYANIALAGIVLVVAGQTMRTLAMVHSGSNFSHKVAIKKRADHELVRSGVYRYVYCRV